MEELNARRATEEAVAKAERTRIAAETAKKREEEDFKKRAREKIQKEIDQVRIDEARKLAESLKQKGGLKVDADVSLLSSSFSSLPFSSTMLEWKHRLVSNA